MPNDAGASSCSCTHAKDVSWIGSSGMYPEEDCPTSEVRFTDSAPGSCGDVFRVADVCNLRIEDRTDTGERSCRRRNKERIKAMTGSVGLRLIAVRESGSRATA